jgi:putative membrane protein
MTEFHIETFLNAIIYAFTGVIVFVLAFFIIDKMTPYHLWKEIVDDKNIALAIMVGAAALGICIIVAAAIH